MNIMSIISVLVNGCLCWGSKGHQITGILADKFLLPATRFYLNELFGDSGNSSLYKLSTWADEIKNRRIYGNKWAWTNKLHYVTVPPTETYNETCCANNNCIIGAIYNFTLISMNINTKNNEPENIQTSIKFLIHFIGDISQPLHNYGYKRGGNGIHIKFDGKVKNNKGRPISMHSLWDSEMINKYLKINDIKDIYTYTDYLYSKMNFNNKTDWIYPRGYRSLIEKTDNGNSKLATDWSMESFELNKNIWLDYFKNTTQDFGEDYYYHHYNTVELQLMKAGYRIGFYLNEIVSNKHCIRV